MTIENVTASLSDFTIHIILKDLSGNIVAHRMRTQSIDAGTTFTISISILVSESKEEGVYTLDVTAADSNGNNIGE